MLTTENAWEKFRYQMTNPLNYWAGTLMLNETPAYSCELSFPIC